MYHVCFIESHEVPARHNASLPNEPWVSDGPQVNDEPFTVKRITQGANSMPILFDREEEEEFLPTNPRQPIPDDPPNPTKQIPDNSTDLNNHDHDARNDELPETPTVTQLDNVVPGELQR